MSIALTGPEKYDFQDLVCVKIALQFHRKENVSLRIEPKGGEDAELSYENNGNKFKFEIQVKGSLEPISILKIAECLGHFPAYKTSDFLLQRIINDESNRAVFIMAGRAKDSLQKHIPKGEWEGDILTNVVFTREDAKAILNSLEQYANSLVKTKQNEERKLEIINFVKNSNIDTVKSALQRVIVLDGVKTSKLLDECRILLRRDFFIPDDIFQDKVNVLIDLVKVGKTTQGNVTREIANKLSEYAVLSIKPHKYFMRGYEKKWYEELKNKNLIMFSGMPRVGKTNAGKWLAAEFQYVGYRVFVTQSVEEAERFLLDPIPSHRLVLLDDPLGGVHPVNKPHEKLSRIKNLISFLKFDRKLIITQGQERLLETMQEASLEEVSLYSHQWNDLGKVEKQFLIDYWLYMVKEFSIPQVLEKTVTDFLSQNESNIELGCLSYLAAEHSKINAYKDIEKILRFARKDADDLGGALSSEVEKDILMGLAIATNHLEKIHDNELAWVLNENMDKRYGFSSFMGTSFTFGSSKAEEKLTFPSYDPIPNLTKMNKESLGLLETRLMVEIDAFNRTTFSHPFYRAAAESMVRFVNRFSFTQIIGMLNNGIFCLSPSTARATAKNINWIYGRAKKNSEKKGIIDVAISGLNSSYPSVRDICFEFLTENVLALEHEYENQLTSWVYKVNTDNLSSLSWHDGQPWYPMGVKITIESSIHDLLSNNYNSKILGKISDEDVTQLSSQKAYYILKQVENTPNMLSEKIMQRLLSINEGLIRALAAKVWMMIDRQEDDYVLERIFLDTHPAVAESVFKSSIRAWDTLQHKRKNYIFEKLKKMASQPVLAHAIIGDLVIFERGHELCVNPPWEVFSALLSIALESLPPSVNLNRARLSNVVHESVNKLSSEAVLSIISSWIIWLEKIHIDRQEDDFSLTVTSIIFRVTRDSIYNRTELFKRLLALDGTGVRVRVISDLIEHWDLLVSEEKEIISSFVTSGGKDNIWIKSAVLTSRNIPNELLGLIIGCYKNEGLTSEDILELELPLLTSAIQMYVGNPQPLWWYGTHHRNKALWPHVISLIAYNSTHPLFKIAFKEILFHGTEKEVFNVIYNSDKKSANLIFEIMLDHFIVGNPSEMKDAWHCLFHMNADVRQKTQWVKELASNAQNIFDYLSDANQIVPDDSIDEFYSYFKSDRLIIEFTSTIISTMKVQDCKDSKNIEEITEFLPLLRKLFELNPPNHYSVCDYVSGALRRVGIAQERFEFVFERRNFLLSEKDANEDSASVEQLDNWVY